MIAGRYRRRVLMSPAWEGLRPTSDRLKQTLFDVLGPRVDGATVLDGFAGSGALGIEALSRGAREVVFVDCDARALALVEANLARCGVAKGYAMIRGDFMVALQRLASGRLFDLVMLDPPYGFDAAGVLEAAAERVAAGGTLVLEHARRRPAPGRAGRLVCERRLAAGDSGLAFYGEAFSGEAAGRGAGTEGA